MTVYRDTLDNGNLVTEEVFHLMECTYSGKDMGERKVVANIKWATPIDFKTGDYIELQMQTLNTGAGLEGAIGRERFYIYTQPTIKKNARAMSSGEAFEHTVTFYPRQYELGCVQMRDYIQQNANADTIIYTGFDSVSFVGGAHELMERVMACLAESFHDEQGHPLWSYELSPSVNEDLNMSLERFPFSFSGNSVMDALLKLNDKEGINTTFFINGRTIYVGYRRPYFCRVTDGGSIDTDVNSQIFNFEYGKTSHEPIGIDHGGLFNITKAVGNESPITKLYAYGASRNLNRYYCADRIRSGRYVNRLMLPSFDDDGRTDYIISEEGVAKYGIREASKQFEDIYPSLRYMTYGDLRQVKYCIKVKASGLATDAEDLSGHSIADSTYPIVRIQCYKVVESAVQGVNKLIECAPPADLAVMIHATGKVVKTILYGGATNQEALAKQLSHDAKVPTRDGGTDYIPGSCFAVHDYGYGGDSSHGRAELFTSPHVWAEYEPEKQERINTHQITYADTFWLTDLYIFTEYEQTVFNRDGYSAWAYPRINAKYPYATDSTLVNEIVAVEPIVIEDTSWNVSERTNQQYFDIYMRDVGFKIDEQNDFGEMVFIVDGTLKVSVLDGLLTGREFEVSGKVTDSQFSCVCAYNEDGTENEEFWTLPDSPRTSTGSQYARAARDAGAIWRIRLLRLNNNDQNYANLDIILPMKGLEMHAGDHVVFLDIFMPDVYIHAAENRLERAARKYLYANDNGTVNYSVEFDKVRVGQQIPNYALQMREGLNIRMRDADLDIVTQSGAKVLADYMPKGLTSMVQMYSQEEAYDEYEGRLYNPENGSINGLIFYAYAEDGNRYLKFKYDVISPIQLSGDNIVVSAFEIGILTNKSAIRYYDVVDSAVAMFTPKTSAAGTYKYELVFRFDELSTLKRMLKDAKYERVGSKDYVMVYMKATTHVYTGQVQESAYIEGKEYYCKSNEVFDFMRNKYYDVVIDIPETACLDYVEDLHEPKVPELVLSAVPASDGYNYKPQILHAESALGIGEGAQAFRRYTYTFYLDDSFNEDYAYKPAIKFIQDGETESCSIRLQKIVEKDIDVPTPSVNYVDLKVDSVNIKITDNTRPDDRRIQKVYPQPIYDIQATFKEASQASAWMQLSQQVAENAIEAAASTHISESVVNMARRYYRELLSLRSNIFDPDGNCDQVFLNVMMMQVGADSMNFRLEKTAVKQGVEAGIPTIIPTNYTLEKNIVTGNWTFGILSNDTLYHYVFTQGSQGGTWSIENKINGTQQSSVILASQQSEGVTIYPVYYVCLKCQVDGTTGSWLVTTKQYASNDAEDANYWYFNWGILQPDSAGNYSLIETRGNAYMYGDNLVCGRIRSLSGGSFFDLNNGEMVLGGDSGGANGALEYKNGRLSIKGSSSNIGELVSESVNIGGRNLLRDTAFGKKGKNLSGWSRWTMDGHEIKTHADDNTVDDGSLMINFGSSAGYQFQQTCATGSNVQGDIYTLSAKAKVLSGSAELYFGEQNTAVADRVSASLTTKYKKIKLTIELGSLPSGVQDTFVLYTYSSCFVLLKEVKLERGNVATDWSEAPEDTVAEIVENKTYIDSIKTNLQNQIDNEVDSYFMKGAPTLQNAPANEWTTDADKARHEGDTYTNIQMYTLIERGMFEQGSFNENKAGYGWESGEVKYGGSTSNNIRLKELIPNEVGNVVHLGDYTTYKFAVIHFNSEMKAVNFIYWNSNDLVTSDYPYIAICVARVDGTKAEIEDVVASGICINPTAGHSWRFCNYEDADETTWHWHEIADSDAVRALQQAAEAQDTADGKRRVFSTPAGSLPVPPYDFGDLWANATYPSTSPYTHNNALLKCTTARAQGETASVNDWIDASRALSAADNAQVTATSALTKANNIADDGIISGGTEKSTLKKEWQAISGSSYDGTSNGSYYKARSQASAYGLTSAFEYTVLGTSFTNLKTAMDAILANMSTDFVLATSGGASYDTKDEFIALWRTYYDAEIAMLNAVSKVIDEREIGGENLYSGAEPLVLGGTVDTDIVLKSGKQYVVYIGRIEGNARGLYIRSKGAGDVYTNLNTVISDRGSTQPTGSITPITEYIAVVTGDGGTLSFVPWHYSGGDSQFTLTDVMVQRGSKPTAYQSSYKFLAEAFEHDATKQTTDINGGLLATSLLKLRNMNGVVTAGMSGLDDQGKKVENGVFVAYSKSHGVGMWAGATYQQALEAAAGLRRIPVLFTKDGIGSMVSVFLVKEDKIEVNGPNGTIVVDDDEGMTIYDASNYLKSIITPRSISNSQSGVQGMINNSVITFPSTSSDGYMYQDITLNNTSRSEKHQILASAIESDGRKHISLDVGVRFRGWGQPQQELSNFPSMIFKVTLENQNTGEIAYLSQISGAATIYQDEYDNFFFSQFNKFSIDQDLSEGTYAMYVEICFNVTNEEYTENAQYYQGLIDDYMCHLEIDNKVVNEILSRDYERQVVVGETMRNTFGVKVGAYTILGNDGILSYYNANTYFKVINDANGQKIYAKGLGTTGESGQLIKKTGVYKAFANNLRNFMHHYFKRIAKEEGFTDALDALVDSLPDDTFITSV